MKKLLLSLALVPLMAACQKNDNPEHYNVQSIVSFSVQDQNGADLLDPTSTASLDISTLKIKYQDKNNQYVEYHNPMMDWAHGFSVRKSGQNNNFHPAYYGDYYVLHVCIDNYNKIADEQYESTALIEWSPGNIDTLECKIQSGNGWTRITQVTINQAQPWDIAQGQMPDFSKVIDGGKATFTRHITTHK